MARLRPAKIRDVAAYLCAKYPYKDELSKARLTKLVYLADWRNAMDHREQMTAIKWYFNNFGPYVTDVIDAARRDRENFKVEHTSNAFGAEMDLVSLRRLKVDWPTLTEEDQAVLDEVIGTTQRLNFSEFIEFVYDTYPIKTRPRHSTLDLEQLALQRAKKR